MKDTLCLVSEDYSLLGAVESILKVRITVTRPFSFLSLCLT